MIVEHAFAQDHLIEAVRELARGGDVTVSDLQAVAEGMRRVADGDPAPPAASGLRALADHAARLANAPAITARPRLPIDYFEAIAAGEHRRRR
jgi:hypothetical protein